MAWLLRISDCIHTIIRINKRRSTIQHESNHAKRKKEHTYSPSRGDTMNDHDKSREDLIEELRVLRQDYEEIRTERSGTWLLMQLPKASSTRP